MIFFCHTNKQWNISIKNVVNDDDDDKNNNSKNEDKKEHTSRCKRMKRREPDEFCIRINTYARTHARHLFVRKR